LRLIKQSVVDKLRFADWGLNPMDQKVLIALELDKQDRALTTYLFPKQEVDKDLLEKIQGVWVEGEDVEIPKSVEQHVLPLTEDSIIPEDIRADNPAAFRAIQNDWAYTIFVEQFWKVYLDELAEIKEQARLAERYDRDLFEKTKSFWDRVLEQKKEQNIGQEKIDEIKNDVDLIFEKLKALRQSHAEARKEEEEKAYSSLNEQLQKAKEMVEGGKPAPEVIPELKQLRSQLNKSGLRGSKRQEISDGIDACFDQLGKKKQQKVDGKLQKRIDDLQAIIKKMERSIDRDKKELSFQEKRMDSSRTSDFELKLRETKMEMLKEQLKSKEDKLEDIRKTLSSLESKAGK
jgi:DNA repair exonuclease SbcCD ATPase subunit